MKGLKITLIAAIAVGLVAGATGSAVAQADPMEASEVTGTTAGLENVGHGSRAFVDGALRYNGQKYTSTWDASDSRLDGAVSITLNRDDYVDFSVGSTGVVVENDDGDVDRLWDVP
jgi:hypothetical protein